jgi:hypothetical protein
VVSENRLNGHEDNLDNCRLQRSVAPGGLGNERNESMQIEALECEVGCVKRREPAEPSRRLNGPVQFRFTASPLAAFLPYQPISPKDSGLSPEVEYR